MQESPEVMIVVPLSEGFDPSSDEAQADVLDLMGNIADRCKKVGGCTLNMGVGAGEDGLPFIGTHCEAADELDSFEGCTVHEAEAGYIEEQLTAITKNSS
jgi:hypothetical protein